MAIWDEEFITLTHRNLYLSALSHHHPAVAVLLVTWFIESALF